MNRASPVELRRAMEVAQTFTKAGILFVAIPVLNDTDHKELITLLHCRMQQMMDEAEKVQP